MRPEPVKFLTAASRLSRAGCQQWRWWWRRRPSDRWVSAKSPTWKPHNQTPNTHSTIQHTHTHTHTLLTALCPGLPGQASTREVKPIWILLKQETVSGSGISWTVCKSAPHSRQITTPAPHHSVFYRPDALRAAQPTASKHWRHSTVQYSDIYNLAKGKRVPK